MGQDSFIEALLPAGFGRNERLERIGGLIDWAPIGRLVAMVRPGETGRPPYDPLAMFKALLLAQWYGLSDPGLEEALLDRVSFRRFCGLALDAATPDETTLCRFRNGLKAAGLGEGGGYVAEGVGGGVVVEVVLANVGIDSEEAAGIDGMGPGGRDVVA